jgi:hypothetical protein
VTVGTTDGSATDPASPGGPVDTVSAIAAIAADRAAVAVHHGGHATCAAVNRVS